MKKQVNPVITAIVLILALGAVLFVYTKGLLGKKPGPEGDMKGGGMEGAADPPIGLERVTVGTLAGWSAPGHVDGAGWDAKFNGPSGIALAPDGSLYVSDSRNHRIRHITPDGAVTTAAGSGPTDSLQGGYVDGPAEQAQFFSPAGLDVRADGAVCIADTGNHRIRMLKDGVVTTVAGTSTPADEFGIEEGGYRDGPVAEAVLMYPVDVSVTGIGALLVADLGNHAIRRVMNGTVTTETTQTTAPTGVLGSPHELLSATLYTGPTIVADLEGESLLEAVRGAAAPISLTGHVPTQPAGIDRLPDGSLIVVDTHWHAVFAVNASGKSTLLAGIMPEGGGMPGTKDGNGSSALFTTPCAVVARGWTAYVADFGNNCIRTLEIPPDWATPPPTPEPDPRWGGRPSGGGGGKGGKGGKGGGGRGPGQRPRRDGDRSAD